MTCASYCGHYAAVKALLEVGNVDVNLTRQDGTTPLNLAAYADAKTALLLLDYGAAPDTNTSKSSPFPVPLVMSAARGDVDLCARLIQVYSSGGRGKLSGSYAAAGSGSRKWSVGRRASGHVLGMYSLESTVTASP